MADVSNPTPQKIDEKAGGIDVNHPAMTEALRNMKKNGVEKERAVKLSGMPPEVVDKVYRTGSAD